MKIAIIGAGGRTATLFAQVLKKSSQIYLVGREREVKLINSGKVLVEKMGEKPKAFKHKVIRDIDFLKEDIPDYIFLTTRNPVGPVVKYYYQKIKEKNIKIPALILSQNGIRAGEEAVKILEELKISNFQIIRLNLFNPVDSVLSDDKICLKYFDPIRLVFSEFCGHGKTREFANILEKAGVEYKEYSREDVKNMEYSKLFLNLIGMASASHQKSVSEGFEDINIFKEEILMLREFIEAVEKSNGKFINFPKYPVKILSCLVKNIPINILVLFRKKMASIITKGRGDKPKDLAEIDYYNGGVIFLARKIGTKAPINEKIYNKSKKILKL